MNLRTKPFAIGERIEEAVDRSVDADVSWSGVELILIRTFPSLTLGLHDLRVVGTESFAGDTLASLDRVRIALDVGSVIRSLRHRGALVVRSVRVETPTLRLQVREDGAPSRTVAVALDELESWTEA